MHDGQTIEPVRQKGWIGAFLEFIDSFEKKRPFLTGLFKRIVVSIILDKVFDNVLYPLAQAKWGVLGGTAAMTVASGFICYLLFLLPYDYFKRDEWGLEKEKMLVREHLGLDISDKAHTSALWGLTALVILPIATDPFTALVRIRRQNEFVMNKGYWMFFYTAIVIGNIGWGVCVALVSYAVGEFVRQTEYAGNPYLLFGIIAIALIVLAFLASLFFGSALRRILNIGAKGSLARQVEW